MSVKETIRKRIPNWFWLRSLLAREKVKKYYKHVIPDEYIEVGEADPIAKADLVEHYAKAWPDYAIAVDNEIDKLFARADCYKGRTDLDSVRMDMRFCRFAYGFQPDEYLSFGLEGAPIDVRKSYVSDIDRNRYFCQMNDVVDFVTFMDKMETYRRFGDYYGREAICVSGQGDFEIFKAFVTYHPTFVKKRVDLSKGQSVALVDLTDATEDDMGKAFETLVGAGKHILEEPISQCSTMAMLNASSVNTVRCITFNTKRGIVIPYCFLKVGREGSFVDNGGAGGILVGINRQTGVLETKGFDEFGRSYEEHPDSHVEFEGFALPEWDKAIVLATEASKRMPNVKYLGWDLAHTDYGWIVVEGNGGGQMIGPQIVWQRGVKDEVERIMEDMELFA